MSPATYRRWVHDCVVQARHCLREYVIATAPDLWGPRPGYRGRSWLASYHRQLTSLREMLSDRAGWWRQDEQGAQ